MMTRGGKGARQAAREMRIRRRHARLRARDRAAAHRRAEWRRQGRRARHADRLPLFLREVGPEALPAGMSVSDLVRDWKTGNLYGTALRSLRFARAQTLNR